MKLQPSDPDIETIFRRIQREELDLQPDFQRGEVWPKKKQKRLIDSILRGWHIPPVHVVENPTLQKGEVLDGQQRLAAIRDFMNGKFTVDGTTEPESDEIKDLDRLQYAELPKNIRRAFDGFTIRVFTLHDYTSDEPAELFFRLNQNSSLTPPEQRNAFFGEARNQVRRLARSLPEIGIDDELLGFTNSRMAHDDIVARTLFTLDVASLRKKVTSGALAARYRDGSIFSAEATDRMDSALRQFSQFSETPPDERKEVKFNKATVYSWWVFLARTRDSRGIGDFVHSVEVARSRIRAGQNSDALSWNGKLQGRALEVVLSTFNDRASSRVADTTSVVARDMVLWILYRDWCGEGSRALEMLSDEENLSLDALATKAAEPRKDGDIASLMDASGWGEVV